VAGVRTYFHYADEGLIGEYDSTGTEIKTYGYKPGSTWTTDPLFMKVGTEYYFYQNDHLGTPQKMTAVNGAVVWSAKYSSFGEATVNDASTVTNPLRFPGQYYDAETGLHYNYHRYYDPKTGRYLKTDPIGLDGGINLFTYALNNPLIFTDPEGKLIPELIGWFQCLYYSKKVADYSEMCKEELKKMRKDNKSCNKLGMEADIDFMTKYNSHYLSEAIAKCAAEKCPDKELASKWISSCFSAGWGAPPKFPKIPRK